MQIKVTEPKINCRCKICGEQGTLKKNIGEYCYNCLRKYNIKYPEYIPVEQYYIYLKATLEKVFDKMEEI